jgi:hypothetical protein
VSFRASREAAQFEESCWGQIRFSSVEPEAFE